MDNKENSMMHCVVSWPILLMRYMIEKHLICADFFLAFVKLSRIEKTNHSLILQLQKIALENKQCEISTAASVLFLAFFHTYEVLSALTLASDLYCLMNHAEKITFDPMYQVI